MGKAPPSLSEQLRRILVAGAWAAGILAYVWAVGWLFATIQFAAARLPGLATAQQLSAGLILSRGLAATLLMLLVLAAGCALAYLSSARKWDVNRRDWHEIVNHGLVGAFNRSSAQERGRRQRAHLTAAAERAGQVESALQARRGLGWAAHVPAAVSALYARRASKKPAGEPEAPELAPLGDAAVRLIAGVNIMVLAGLVAVAVARHVGTVFQVRPWTSLSDWLGVVVGVVVFLLVREVLTSLSPLRYPRLHWLLWAIVGVATLFASAPVGLLFITGVALATAGRKLAKLPPERPRLVVATVLAVLLGVTTLLGAAYSATPPVVLPGAVVTTAAGQQLTGGLIARQSSGVYLVTCNALADATSTNERVALVTAPRAVRIGGPSAFLDSGARPSIARLALHALGLAASPPTLFNASLHARQPTCAGAGPSSVSPGVSDPALGAGVIAGPPVRVLRANDSEAPIQADGKTPKAIAALAREYQPTLLVTVADRNWPVSVNAILAERGPNAQPVCLVRSAGPKICPPPASNLVPAGAASGDYLQLPVALGSNRTPSGQFQAFLRGQYQTSGTLHQWLSDPGRLDPWYSAQIYFFDGGPIARSKWPAKPLDPNVPSGLIALEYWFYYPFNYYPVVVDSGLMDQAPIAGDLANIDLHQGDWEHIDVLLDPVSHKPVWLYLARHSSEGQFIPWTSPSMQFDGSHPVVQAAFGGHPSYLPGCGAAPRAITKEASSDWLSCGSGRFAFRADTTPLVNLEYRPWACWPGHFGEATPLEVDNAKQGETAIDTVTHVLYTPGPLAPVVQAENSGDCRGGTVHTQVAR